MKKLTILLTLLFVFGTTVVAQKSTHVQKSQYVLQGDGKQDDTKALNAWGRGKKVLYKGKILGNVLQNGHFLITWGIDFNRKNSVVRHNVFIVRYTGYDSVDILHFGRGVKHKANRTTSEVAQLKETIETNILLIATYRQLIEAQDKLLTELKIESLDKQKIRDNQWKSLTKYLFLY